MRSISCCCLSCSACCRAQRFGTLALEGGVVADVGCGLAGVDVDNLGDGAIKEFAVVGDGEQGSLIAP